ncbi:MAG: ribosome small subunit-dependent GTPase A, partial [bacterium]
IVRRAAGGRGGKVVAANVDRIIAVVAAARPDPSREIVDRLLLIAETNGVDEVLVVNKIDLDEGWARGRELAKMYRGLGYEVLTTSAVTGQGIDELGGLLCRGTSALLGPSGAGKSSLLNAVEPELGLRIGELSRRPGRGRHTTVSSRLIELPCGGRVADTPGFSDVGLWGVEPESLDRFFPDFLPHLAECRFRGCAHLEEPECGVKRAVEEGEIAADRYESYRRIREEAVDASAPPWQR